VVREHLGPTADVNGAGRPRLCAHKQLCSHECECAHCTRSSWLVRSTALTQHPAQRHATPRCTARTGAWLHLVWRCALRRWRAHEPLQRAGDRQLAHLHRAVAVHLLPTRHTGPSQACSGGALVDGNA
jgi:hypothetical protein